MAEFLTGEQLNAALERVIEEASRELFLVSPFIKLNPHLKEKLQNKKEDPGFHLLIAFGKNRNSIHTSLPEEQFEFFKDFAHITIKYEERLHAKYYANGMEGLLSSMNLYDYSINNNIEFGVLVKEGLMGTTARVESQAKDYFTTVFNNATILYDREPNYSKKDLLGRRKYLGSTTKVDELTSVYERLKDKTTRIQSDLRMGYCIRTRVSIPFNIDKPLSDEAFKSWNIYKNRQFKEKYCHFSGEEGETTYEKPILPKYWKEAQKYIRKLKSPSYSKDYRKQLVSRGTTELSEDNLHHDAPNLQEWLKTNPDKGINEYYSLYRKE